jgi:flavin reductase (DIM6/NTAB) family NADH-FMN oxidoreductase RutF
MRNLPLSRVYRQLEPGPVTLVATAHRGRANVMTMSWQTMLDFEPPLLAAVISAGNCSFAALRETGECVIAVPPAKLAKQVVGIGNCHGDEVDKFARFKLATKSARLVAAQLIEGCIANLECRVVDTKMVARYNLFVLEVAKAWHEPALRDAPTLHHRGHGRFALDGRTLKLPSRMA